MPWLQTQGLILQRLSPIQEGGMTKATSKWFRLALLGFLVLISALSPVSSVFAQAPGLGHGFYGTVKVDGVDAPEGTEIIAQVDGTTYGSIAVTTAGSYVGLIVQGDIAEDATVHFYVDGQKADQDFRFHDGWTTELDLTAPAPPVPPAAGGGWSPQRCCRRRLHSGR